MVILNLKNVLSAFHHTQIGSKLTTPFYLILKEKTTFTLPIHISHNQKNNLLYHLHGHNKLLPLYPTLMNLQFLTKISRRYNHNFRLK